MTKKQNKTAKKVLAGSLAVAMLTGNVTSVYAHEVVPQSIIPTNVLSSQAIEEKVAVASVQQAGDLDTLKQLVTQSNIEIQLTADITLNADERLEIKGQNVVIDGQGQFKLNLNEASLNNKLYVRGKGTTIKNLTIEGYKSSAMYLFSTANDSRIENVTLNGNQANIGIDLAGAKNVAVKGVTFSNHKQSGLRLRSNSAVVYEGGNEHNNDYKPLVIIDQNGVSGGTVDSSSAPAGEKQYTKIDEFQNGASALNHYYALAYMVEVGSHDELVEALKNQNTYITFTNSFDLKGNVDITNESTFIKGEGFAINSNGFKFSVKNAQNVSLENVEFRNYRENALTIWNTKNVTLKEVGLMGNLKDNPEKSLVGLDIYGSEVNLTDVYTRNHEYRGISVRNGSTVTIGGSNIHYGDKVDIKMIYGGNDGTASVIKDSEGYYTKGEVITTNGTNTVDYFGKTRKEAPEVEAELTIDVERGSAYDVMDWIEVTDKQDNIDKEITNLKVTVVSDNVVIDKVGVYEVVYEIEDHDGNKVTAKRIINVFKSAQDLTFVEKVTEEVLNNNVTDEEKVEQFKELLKTEGMPESDVNGVSNETYKEVLDYIKNDVDNLAGNYNTLEDVKQLIEDVKNTHTNVTLPSDEPVQDFTLADKVEEILGNTETTDEEKLDQFKNALEEEGVDIDGTSDEIYKEILDHIKNDRDNGTGNYDTTEEIKQLVEDIKNTKTEATLPSDEPVQDFTFIDKVTEEVLSDTNATDEEKVEQFKELLKAEGMPEDDVDGVEDDVLKEVLDFIQKDIDNLTGNYKTLDDVKQLIKDIEDTRTNVTLPSDEPVQDFTFIEKVEELVKDDAKTDEEKLEEFKGLVNDEGINVDGATDEIYNEVLGYIKTDIENGAGEYASPEDVEQLIEDVKNTYTNVTLPDDFVTQDFTFVEKVEDFITDDTLTDEEKVDQFKDALTNEGETNVDDTSDEIYKEVLDYIKGDIENGTGNYTTLEDVKQLIEDVKNTYTHVTLPDDVVVNGIKDIETLDKELQEKVDSLVIETTKTDDGLKVTVKGDKEDLENVDYIEITKDGIFAVVDGEKLPFGNVDLSGLGTDLTGERAVRLDENGGHLAIPHENINGTIKINSRNFENILITHRVPEPFVDVLDKHWFKGDVEDAYNYVFTKGTGSDTFSPKASITRGEFAVMIARALELKPTGESGTFTDTNGKWYANEVQALKDVGIVNGTGDGKFNGNKTITRQEAAKMLTNMLVYAGMDITPTKEADLIDFNKVGNWAKPSVQFLAEQGVLSGNEFKEFKPLNNLTRSEMAKILVKSLRLTDLY